MKSLFFFIFLIYTSLAFGQYDYSDNCIRAHNFITELRFDDARVILAEEKKNNPENLIPLMLDNYIDFLTVIVGEDYEEFKQLEDRKSERLKILEDGDESSPWYLSCIAQIHLQWAFSRVKFEEYFTAAREIRRAFILLNENHEKHPNFLPDKVGLGIMHALIGTIPDNYRWIANLFAMDGSVQLGREELKYVLDNAYDQGHPYLRDEALFFITFIDLNLQANPKRSLELLAYYDGVPSENLMMIYAKSRILMQTGFNDEAIELLLNRPRNNEYYPFFYLDYITGLAKLNRLDEDVPGYLLRFTTNFKGTSYIGSAYQKIAWSYLLQENDEQYHKYMAKVLEFGNDFTDGDKIALTEAEDGLMPNVCLLKARLLYDGGYYIMADSVLDKSSCDLNSTRDKIEYPYRKGRIKQAQEKNDEAIQWYQQTIELGSDEEFYYAANAALQAGNIYETSGDYDQAENFYKNCLKMQNREYRTSLNQKAKAGLNRLEDKRKED